MNRNFVIQDGSDLITVFGKCFHCKEPFAIIGTPPLSLKEKDTTEIKCFCRGANGLSFNIRCCIVLNCIKKKKSYCDMLTTVRGEIFPISKQWNTIVEEPKVIVND